MWRELSSREKQLYLAQHRDTPAHAGSVVKRAAAAQQRSRANSDATAARRTSTHGVWRRGRGRARGAAKAAQRTAALRSVARRVKAEDQDDDEDDEDDDEDDDDDDDEDDDDDGGDEDDDDDDDDDEGSAEDESSVEDMDEVMVAHLQRRSQAAAEPAPVVSRAAPAVAVEEESLPWSSLVQGLLGAPHQLDTDALALASEFGGQPILRSTFVATHMGARARAVSICSLGADMWKATLGAASSRGASPPTHPLTLRSHPPFRQGAPASSRHCKPGSPCLTTRSSACKPRSSNGHRGCSRRGAPFPIAAGQRSAPVARARTPTACWQPTRSHSWLPSRATSSCGTLSAGP